jgi:hypothetical protein
LDPYFKGWNEVAARSVGKGSVGLTDAVKNYIGGEAPDGALDLSDAFTAELSLNNVPVNGNLNKASHPYVFWIKKGDKKYLIVGFQYGNGVSATDYQYALD